MDSSIETGRKRKLDELYCNDSRSALVTISDPTEAFPATIDDSELCSRCSGIDLDEIFKRKIDESSFVVNLGSIAALKESHCQMCRIFASFAPCDFAPPERHLQESAQSLLMTGLYHLRVFNASWVFTGFGARRMNGEDLQDTNVLAVTPSESSTKKLRFTDVYDMRYILCETGYLSLESSINTQSICKVRALNPQVFDFALARAWISYCDENHRTRCSRKTLSELRRFRVFDCRSREVVDAPDKCHYVALSYVWGNHESSGSSLVPAVSPENSRKCLEKVIEDSITVAQKLGLYYLWVDKICIDQSDDEDKRHQINQMDLIYANSALTIIAAAGNGPDHGLPGINGTPRVRQRRFVFRNKPLISTLPAGSYTIQKSKWYTRGWTFQECVLSIRRLIFTEAQVLFECNGMHCNEALYFPLDSMHTRDKRKFDSLAYDMSALSAKAPGSNPAEYMQYIADYSLRELTYREDTLNAFQGVLNAFKRAKKPVYHFWGIPIFVTDNNLSRGSGRNNIARSMSARFVISLFWHSPEGIPRSFVRTKTGFPSWSWAGWDGPVANRLPWGNMENGCFLDVCVWLEDNRKNTSSLDGFNFQPWMCALQDVYSSIIQIEGWTIVVDIVNLHFTSEEKAHFAKKKLGWAMEPHDGVHISFGMGSRGTVYSMLEFHDLTYAYSSNHTFIGFLPSAYGEDQGSEYEYAMLLEKVDGHYERVGLFRPRRCWIWDDVGKLQKIEGRRSGIGRDGLESTKQKFRLG